MGWDVYQASVTSRAIFEAADRVLATGLSRLSFEGPDDELTRTINAQPAILTTSLAYLAAAIESGAIDETSGLHGGT